jgi:hypothetical protein
MLHIPPEIKLLAISAGAKIITYSLSFHYKAAIKKVPTSEYTFAVALRSRDKKAQSRWKFVEKILPKRLCKFYMDSLRHTNKWKEHKMYTKHKTRWISFAF